MHPSQPRRLKTVGQPLLRSAAQACVARPEVGDSLRIADKAGRRGFGAALGSPNDGSQARPNPRRNWWFARNLIQGRAALMGRS